MLVLTRRAGESIMIDGRIELKILRIKGSQVHVGIEAPQDTKIHRKEVWLRLEGEETPEPSPQPALEDSADPSEPDESEPTPHTVPPARAAALS